jgi:hypothetical protein
MADSTSIDLEGVYAGDRVAIGDAIRELQRAIGYEVESPVIRPQDGEWHYYTPIWSSASNPQPSLGNGTLTGLFSRVGRVVHFKIQFSAGNNTTFGTGVWSFQLPFRGPFQFRAMGSALAFDSGTNFRVGMTYLTAAQTCSVVFDSDTNVVQATQPFTWANGDALYIEGTYDAAP